MDNAVGSDIHRGRKCEAGEELFELIRAEELGGFSFFKPSRTDKQRGEVFSNDPSLVIKILQKPPKIITVNPDGAMGHFKLCHKGIEVFNLKLGKLDFSSLQILVQ